MKNICCNFIVRQLDFDRFGDRFGDIFGDRFGDRFGGGFVLFMFIESTCEKTNC